MGRKRPETAAWSVATAAKDSFSPPSGTFHRARDRKRQTSDLTQMKIVPTVSVDILLWSGNWWTSEDETNLSDLEEECADKRRSMVCYETRYGRRKSPKMIWNALRQVRVEDAEDMNIWTCEYVNMEDVLESWGRWKWCAFLMEWSMEKVVMIVQVCCQNVCISQVTNEFNYGSCIMLGCYGQSSQVLWGAHRDLHQSYFDPVIPVSVTSRFAGLSGIEKDRRSSVRKKRSRSKTCVA